MKPLKLWQSQHSKITVEEINAFRFITTFWDKTECLEVDREVYEFETFGGAVDKAFDLLIECIPSRGGTE